MNVRCLAMVHNTTHHCTEADFRYGSFSDLGARSCEVRFTLKNRRREPGLSGPKSANKRHRRLGLI